MSWPVRARPGRRPPKLSAATGDNLRGTEGPAGPAILESVGRGGERCQVARGLLEKEAPHHHRLLEFALADVGFVEQVLDDLEGDARLVAVECRDVGARGGLGAEQYRAQLVEWLGGDARQLAHVVELVDKPDFPGFAEIHKL